MVGAEVLALLCGWNLREVIEPGRRRNLCLGAHLQSRRAGEEHVMDEVIEPRGNGVGRLHAVLRERLRCDASKVFTDIRLELRDVADVEAAPEERPLVVVDAGDQRHVVLHDPRCTWRSDRPG